MNDIKILGIGGSGHDFSLCVVEDGIINVAVEEERFSREKNAFGAKSQAYSCLPHLLKHINASVEDFNFIAANSLMDNDVLQRIFGNKIIYFNHHLTHAASAYYCSGFKESAVFIADASGSDNETISFLHAKNDEISCLEKYFGYMKRYDSYVYRNCSYGAFYAFFTLICELQLFQADKIMEFASYGSDTYLELFRKCFYISSQNTFVTDYENDELLILLRKVEREKDPAIKNIMHQDIAFATQTILEECVLTQLNYLYKITKSPNLCFAGGTALNSFLNSKILEHTPFSNIFIPPSPGDSGTAIGAALYTYYQYAKKMTTCSNEANGHSYTTKKIDTPYFGICYSRDEINTTLQRYNHVIEFEELNEEDLFTSAAQNINDGKIIAWHQGRSEFGSYALGNRSILADPRKLYIKNKINSDIKFHENFHPFLASVLFEHFNDYFNNDDLKEFSFMLFTSTVKPDKKSLLPAITHINGTSKIQIVKQNNNQHFYNLISEFNRLTGIPMVLSTSFNTKNEPLAETPSSAIKTFIKCAIDVLYIDKYRVVKK